MAISSVLFSSRTTAAVAGWILILALAGDPALAKKKPLQIDDVEDLRIVNCLLPGQIRKLGRHSRYVAARRPVRTTAVDCEIRGGDYAAHDPSSYASALQVWLPAAEAGDAKAQTYVGEIFEKGLAGTPDYETAARWYRKAAEQGFSRGQIDLAHLYEKGLGVAEDKEQALGWYRKAAGITEDVVLDSRAQAEELRRELERASAEAAELQEQLEAAEKSLGKSRSELERTREELEQIRRELEAAQADAQASAAAERLAAELRRRETEMARQSQELDRRTEEVAGRRGAFEAFRKRVEEIRGAASRGDTGPTIEIVNPDVLATRGPALVPVPSDARELEIAGKVTAPAGLESLRLGDQQVTADSDGFFRATVAWENDRKEVQVIATDARGRTATAMLILQPAIEDNVTSPPTAKRQTERRKPRRAATGSDSSRYRALVISVASYSRFPALETAEDDAEEFARILSDKYGFQVRVLKDPSHLALLTELNVLAESLESEDHLLIYYAGHGKIEPDSQRGYWIPSDADSDDSGKWIANETISDFLDLIPAKRILVVSDSCYSGTLTRSGLAKLATGQDSREAQAAIAGKRSRTVLTSGGLQPVLDGGGGEHSIFARALLTVLKLNDEPISGALLHREVAARVTYAASELGVEQNPHYAPIQFSGHETGDFVLTPTRRRSSGPAASP